jgi:hypothetical protein
VKVKQKNSLGRGGIRHLYLSYKNQVCAVPGEKSIILFIRLNTKGGLLHPLTTKMRLFFGSLFIRTKKVPIAKTFAFNNRNWDKYL